MKINLKEIATKYKNIGIAIHTRPDGDAVGSAVGLYHGLSAFGASPILLCDMDIPKKVRFLIHTEKFQKTYQGKLDLLIFSDCADIARTGDLKLNLKGVKTLAIDHHQVYSPTCDFNHIVPTSASASELVLEILDENKVEITPEVADVLYTGLMTDTGNFSHTNTTALAFSHAKRLCELGANPNLLNRSVFKLLEGNKHKLMGYVLSNIKLKEDGRIAYFYITKKVLEDFGVDSVATEGLIDFVLSIEGVQIAMAILESNNNSYKVSLRSIADIEVSKVAEHFGGGGHKQASGCTLCGFYEDVVEKLLRQASFYVI